MPDSSTQDFGPLLTAWRDVKLNQDMSRLSVAQAANNAKAAVHAIKELFQRQGEWIYPLLGCPHA
jgi:hypothetical protein